MHHAKRALLVGLNHYPDPANNLKGCVNDVLMSSQHLQNNYGFAVEDIRLLTDERATTANIRKRLTWLASDMRAGDVVVFHYSGHGSQVRDRDGDELKDHLDEIICPYDLNWDDPITDDELGKTFANVPEGASVTVILDSCHSGTALREFGPTPRRDKFIVPPPDVFHRTGPTITDKGVNRSLTMVEPKKELPLQALAKSLAEKQKAVLVAACRANQLSADAWIDGDYHGALTYYFWRSAQSLGWNVTYKEAVHKTSDLLKADNYDQVPQLEGPSGKWKLFAPLVSAARAA